MRRAWRFKPCSQLRSMTPGWASFETNKGLTDKSVAHEKTGKSQGLPVSFQTLNKVSRGFVLQADTSNTQVVGVVDVQHQRHGSHRDRSVPRLLTFGPCSTREDELCRGTYSQTSK
jgi:hypothetical protein